MSGPYSKDTGFPWRVGAVYRLRPRKDSPDFLAGIDPDKVGERWDVPIVYGKAKVIKITNLELPRGFQTIFVQVNDMVGTDGRPLLLATGPDDLRIARTAWCLTDEEIADSDAEGSPAQEAKETDPASYQSVAKSRFFIKSGTLHELDDELGTGFIKRALVLYQSGYRWRGGGVAFAPYFHDAKFISEADALRFERALRASFKRHS